MKPPNIEARITIYEPEERFGGFFGTILTAADEIRRSRFLIWKLFVRDFKAQMRQKILGYLWAFIAPLLIIFGFIVMNVSGVLKPGETGVPYPVYVFVGASIFGFLTTTVLAISDGFLKQGELMLKTNVPKIAIAISSLAQIVYNLIVHLIMLVLIMVLFQIPPHLLSPLYVVTIIPMIVLGIAIGLFVSVLGVIARDIGIMVQSVLTLLMYITPVVYVAASLDNAFIQNLIWWNPLTYLVEVPRSLLLHGTTELWLGYGLSTLASLAALMICTRGFYIVQDLIAERL